MLLLPFLAGFRLPQSVTWEWPNDSGLVLIGFSFKDDELSSVDKSLGNANINVAREKAGVDRAGRMAARWFLSDFQLERFEEYLQIKFLFYGDRTVAVPSKKGKGYRCGEIHLAGSGPGCEEFEAKDMSDARVKCALIASKNYWFGGDPSIGSCHK
jgi:hypothetical protein